MIFYTRPKVLKGHYEELPMRTLRAENIRLDGPVTLTKGQFDFSPDTRIYLEEGSRLTAGGFKSFRVGELIGQGAGGEHPFVELMPADPTMNPNNRWEPINTLQVYHDSKANSYWGENPTRWTSYHSGGNVVLLNLNRNRFSSFDFRNPDLSHYETNRWLINGYRAEECEIELDGEDVLVKLTFKFPLPVGPIKFWTDAPEKYQRNVHIRRIEASDSTVGALSAYGLVNAHIGEIMTHGGIDAVTLEYCRSCRVDKVFGIDTHQAHTGKNLLVELFLAENNSIGERNGPVTRQTYGAYQSDGASSSSQSSPG